MLSVVGPPPAAGLTVDAMVVLDVIVETEVVMVVAFMGFVNNSATTGSMGTEKETEQEV